MSQTQLPKVLSPGHKTLNASEAKALQELLKSEKERRKYFEENKYKMVRSRNPLTGEATPRDGQGEPIINHNFIQREPNLLRRKKDKELTEKIGVTSERYNCLGNLSNQEQKLQQQQQQQLQYQQNNQNPNYTNTFENFLGYSSRLPPPSSRIGLDSKQSSGRLLLTQHSA